MIMVRSTATTQMAEILFQVIDGFTGEVFVTTRCPVKACTVAGLLRRGEIIPSHILFT